MRYETARAILSEAIEQLDETTKRTVRVKAQGATQSAKSKAANALVAKYGDGKVTFRKEYGGDHSATHRNKHGETRTHEYHPETGKISRHPYITTSY